MPHSKLLNASECVLVVVDVQEAFRNVIPDFAEIAPRISTAVRGFEILGVPVLATEQYPKGLGPTAEEISLSLPETALIFEKDSFSACGSALFVKKLDELNANKVVLCGIEAHICVNQTAFDLFDAGFEVHLLSDCISSRFALDKEAGLSRMYAGGAVPSSVEMALFELLRVSSHDNFKQIQALIK